MNLFVNAVSLLKNRLTLDFSNKIHYNKDNDNLCFVISNEKIIITVKENHHDSNKTAVSCVACRADV